MVSIDGKAGVNVPMNAANAEGDFSGIPRFASDADFTNDMIQIRKVRLPELRVGDGDGQCRFGRSAGNDGGMFVQTGNGIALTIADLNTYDGLGIAGSAGLNGNPSMD